MMLFSWAAGWGRLGGLLLSFVVPAGGLLAQPAAHASVVTPRPLVIGHAGSGFVHLFNALPPSSLRSLRRALRRGADGVEVDVRLSQDSIPVLYHNHTLESMTDGTGCVSQTPAARLTGLRYRVGWLHNWRQREQLITLETFLAQLAQYPTFPYLHLDLHEDDACSSGEAARSAALARRLQQLLARYQLPAERVLILTNRSATLHYLRRLLPAVPLGFEFTEGFDTGLQELAGLPTVGAAVLHKDDVTPERVAWVRALGKQVVVFGGRSGRAVRRVVGVGPDSYEVDNVRRLRATLRRR
ncbi:glycerophosphoryl diester phosphodiesterase [Hymenobacter luteus]|uniref:Glycerophosphoryl diester phosphodiesterase n=2 Tax=Hymenobacter TaxID=89966 RepID=A0A7W9T0Y1_9BACT|nr:MULTISPECIES: glycerophosphodiester phosphodiesterase family protein [Hymenobacter]MBB4601990.1 glycerophosphoryl diester phosphodiesterase [Hymenobacter latericoloratus]MBB6059581.1 glycerophosphoryl diester phosphodiesterase [Hymenobacter luteus]